MPLEYLTVDHLSTKDLIRIFSKICIHPELQFNGTPCWIWTAGLTLDGYGRTYYHNVPIKSHQLMFAWTVHPLPRKQQANHLDHLCRRPACCNPLHLEFVTARINVLRANGVASQNARKTHCKHGHPLNGDNLFYDQGKRQCRACKRTQSALRRQRHPEASRAAVNKWQSAHKDEITAKRAANRDTYNARAREAYRLKRIKEQVTSGSQ